MYVCMYVTYAEQTIQKPCQITGACKNAILNIVFKNSLNASVILQYLRITAFKAFFSNSKL